MSGLAAGARLVAPLAAVTITSQFFRDVLARTPWALLAAGTGRRWPYHLAPAVSR